MSRNVFGRILSLSLALTIVLAALPPGTVRAYTKRTGHFQITRYALELLPAPEMVENYSDISHGSIDEDETDHVYHIWCWETNECTCTHFWDADGTHGNGPGGPYDRNKALVFGGHDDYDNAFMKASILFFDMALPSYLAGDKPHAYEYLGHVAHLLEDMTEPSHAHEDYWPDHGNYESWVGSHYEELGDGPWGTADAVAAGGPVVIPDVNLLRDTVVYLKENNYAYIPDDMPDWPDAKLQLYYLFYTANQYGDYFNSPDYGGDSDEAYGWVSYDQTGDLRPGYGSFPVDAEGLPNRWPSGGDVDAEEVMGGYLFVYAIRAVVSLFDLFLDQVDATAPTTDLGLSGLAGKDSWYHSDVGVNLAGWDNPGGIGVRSIAYSATGAQPIASTTVSGAMAAFTISAEGTTDIAYYATDWAGNVETPQTATIKIDKVDPVITIVTPEPGAILPAGTALDFSASDGLSGLDALEATLTDGTSTVYVTSGDVPAPGVYTLTAMATDIAGNQATETRDFVIYDAGGGFVTGSGWFSSPAGAFAANPTLTGRAFFGLSARYLRGTTIPSGATQFQVAGADLRFRSTSYDWLVVPGAGARFQGTGTINGQGSYGFLVAVIDGQAPGGGGTDRFRIRIWDQATGEVVYDNEPGAADGADPITAVVKGAIVIHN